MEKTKLVFYGRCRKCGRFLVSPVTATFDEKDLLQRCDGCNSHDIGWETSLHRHNIKPIKRKGIHQVKIIAWTITILLVLAITAAIVTPYVLAHREYSDEEMAAAVKVTTGMSIDSILTRLNRDKVVAKLVGVGPHVIQRLRTGTTTATPAMAASIRGVYCQYVLNKRSWLITRMQVGVTRGAADMYYAFPNPQCENN